MTLPSRDGKMELPVKTCKKCGTSFDGKECPVCMKARAAAYREKNREKIKAYRVNYYSLHAEKIKAKVKKWGEENPEKRVLSDSKWRADNAERLKATKAKWQADNREKVKLDHAKWMLNNPDKVKQHYVKSREKNIDKIKARGAKYRAENVEKEKARCAKYRAANPEKRKETSDKYRATHVEECRLIVHNRNARKRENGCTLTRGLTSRLFKLQRGKCPCCGKPLGKDYHIDHKKPLALGGQNVDSNIQLLRAICNMQKGAKDPVDFMQSRGFLL